MQCSGHRAKTDSALSMAAACSYTLQEYDSVHKADKYLKLGGLGSLPALIAVHESARSAVQRHITPTQCSLAKGVAVIGYSGNQGVRDSQVPTSRTRYSRSARSRTALR